MKACPGQTRQCVKKLCVIHRSIYMHTPLEIVLRRMYGSCTCKYVCMCMYTYRVCMQINMHMYVYIYIYAHVCTCILHICEYMPYVCVYMYTIPVRLLSHVRVCVYMFIHLLQIFFEHGSWVGSIIVAWAHGKACSALKPQLPCPSNNTSPLENPKTEPFFGRQSMRPGILFLSR